MSAERAMGDRAPEQETSGERRAVTGFLAEMVGRQPRVVAETLQGIAGELAQETGSAISVPELNRHLMEELKAGAPNVEPDEARKAALLIRSEELNPQSSLWQENPGAPSMVGRIARLQREALREILCDVTAAGIRGSKQ